MTGVPLFRIKPVAFSDDPRDNEANFRKIDRKIHQPMGIISTLSNIYNIHIFLYIHFFSI